uniref:Uncharacterized protein n=1 Tax=Kryptolebias marmoratus TaxID=37003 RepID=A0A3Q3EV02_KRYMA
MERHQSTPISNIQLKTNFTVVANQFPTQLHESGGKLFCTSCSVIIKQTVIIEHKRIDKHFVSAKHVRRAADEGQSRNGHECQFISYQSSQIKQLLRMSIFVGNYLTKLPSIFGLYIKIYVFLLILVKKKKCNFSSQLLGKCLRNQAF